MAFSWLGKVLSFRKTKSDQVLGPRHWFYTGTQTPIDENSSMRVAAFYRGVNYVSTQVAKLPWEVKDKNNNVLINHPVNKLLSIRPNPEMNAFSFKLCMLQNAMIHGNAYAEIEWSEDLRTAKNLWIIPSTSVDMVRTSSGELLYRVSTVSNPYSDADIFEYGGNNGSSNGGPTGSVYLRPFEIFHLKNFHTKDGLVGQGVAAYASEALGIQISADQMAGGIFRNGGIPSGVLEVTGTLSDESFARLKKEWHEQMGGRKAGSTALLENGTKYSPIVVDPQILQFLESRKFGIQEIARFLNVPPTKLFDTTAATYSNMEQANLEVATDVLDSWCCNFEMEADAKLLNNRFGGNFSEMDLYSVFRGDMKTRSEYFSKMLQIGTMNPNEIRNREGLAPYSEGNRFYIADNNFSPIDRMDEKIDADIKAKEAKSIPPKDATPSEDDEGEEEVRVLRQAAAKFLLESK